MSALTKGLLAIAVAVGVIGAMLAFALDGNDSIGPLNGQALGGVLLGLAVVLLVAAAISLARPGSGESIPDETLRTLTGLVAVVAGIVAVGALTVITVELVGVGKEGNTEATVAITTSAFGIVSTVITAYLGIKATANAVNRVTEVEAEGETEE